MSMVFCRGCGKEIHETAPACPHCGAPQFASTRNIGNSISAGPEFGSASSGNEYISALKKYAVFTGRATRKEYWMFILYNILISIAIGVVEGLIGATNEVASNIYSLAVFIPSIAVGVRRMHDTNRSGWWILLPIVNLVFLCQKSADPTTTEPSKMSALAVVALVFCGLIPVIGILAAIALPAYQDYIVRSKMSEPLAALAEAKTTIAEFVAANGDLPFDSTSLDINTASRPESDIIASLSLDDHVSGDTIRIVANVANCTWDGGECNDTDFRSFHLAGIINADGTMSWVCLPGDTNGDNAIESKYLPANCRG